MNHIQVTKSLTSLFESSPVSHIIGVPQDAAQDKQSLLMESSMRKMNASKHDGSTHLSYFSSHCSIYSQRKCTYEQWIF